MKGEEPMTEKMRNEGWNSLAEDLAAEPDFHFFEDQFNAWQKQAILLLEFTHTGDYHYITPLGVFTHLGTLARALQSIFEKEWELHAILTGSDLHIHVEKGIAGASHTLECKFVEIDQAFSQMHMDGWKLERTVFEDTNIPRVALIPMAKCLIEIALDPELEGASQYAFDTETPGAQDHEIWYACADEIAENKIKISISTLADEKTS